MIWQWKMHDCRFTMFACYKPLRWRYYYNIIATINMTILMTHVIPMFLCITKIMQFPWYGVRWWKANMVQKLCIINRESISYVHYMVLGLYIASMPIFHYFPLHLFCANFAMVSLRTFFSKSNLHYMKFSKIKFKHLLYIQY